MRSRIKGWYGGVAQSGALAGVPRSMGIWGTGSGSNVMTTIERALAVGVLVPDMTRPVE